MFNISSNGNYWYYEWEDGSKGFVKADSHEEAERKIRESYRKHEYEDIFEICAKTHPKKCIFTRYDRKYLEIRRM